MASPDMAHLRENRLFEGTPRVCGVLNRWNACDTLPDMADGLRAAGFSGKVNALQVRTGGGSDRRDHVRHGGSIGTRAS